MTSFFRSLLMDILNSFSLFYLRTCDYIVLNGFYQLLFISELPDPPQAPDELELHLPAIERALEAREVGLDAGVFLPERGPGADVDHPAPLDRVHPAGRYGFMGRVEGSRRKTQPPSPPLSADHVSINGDRPAQHPARRLQLAPQNEPANAGAGDDPPPLPDRRDLRELFREPNDHGLFHAEGREEP